MAKPPTKSPKLSQFPTYLALLCLRCYRLLISPLLANHCRFTPSCSEYAQEALQQYGLIKGCALSIRRLSKCHPWHKGGFDPLPEHHHESH